MLFTFNFYNSEQLAGGVCVSKIDLESIDYLNYTVMHSYTQFILIVQIGQRV